ncbi:ABC transporter substrate-binding protein [Thioalkalivibrio sp. XN279]|uniref:ABC transporter substrate-binding protein n=1 Tax=Thioalkalivibrio sp. XN279 TaxID=2714953 RepID=UPI0014077C52|nr:substrate-binding domain-containing protein [Thioalkalivibrio sp. XN279]
MALCDDNTGQPGFRVAVFTPTTANNTYWPEVHSILRAAASDLDISLEIHEFNLSDRFEKVSVGVRRLTTEPLPDAAVFSVEFGEAVRLMDAAEQAGIPFFLNGPLFPEELNQLGELPGQAYQHWVGYFLEDEELKGYLLAQKLIAAARRARNAEDDGTIYVAGINGTRSWYGSILREAGLRRAIDDHPDVELLQMVYTRWTPEEGRRMASRILRRYPEVSVLWTASDQLAIGVAETISNGLAPDDLPVHTGGLDLSGAGIESVLQGDLVATVASSSLLWAQVIIDLYDHLQGVDRASHADSVLLAAPSVADRSTAESIRSRIREFEAIDFRQFSRFHEGADAPRLDEIMGDW